MRLILKLTVVALLITELTSCRAIFIRRKQTITIKTGNDKAEVYLNNLQFGSGDVTKAKIKKIGVQQVVVTTPGFRDANYVMIPQKRVASNIPLLLLDIYWVIAFEDPLVDLNKTFKYSKYSVFTPKTPYQYKQKNQKYINIDKIGLNIENQETDINFYHIKHSQNLENEMSMAERELLMNRAEEKRKAEEKAKKKKKKNQQLLNTPAVKSIKYDDTKFSLDIHKTLVKTGYTDTIAKIFVDDNNTLTLEASIRKVNFYIVDCLGEVNYAKAKTNITWYIKNTYNEKVDSINNWYLSEDFVVNESSQNAINNSLEKMIANNIDLSLAKLMTDTQFTKYLNVNSNFNINDSVLTIINNNPVTHVNQVNDATVTIKRKKGGHGSGFAISNDGYLLTNYHVIADEIAGKTADIVVLLKNGQELPVQVVRYNKMRDIALLKVDYSFIYAFHLANDKQFKKLSTVYASGTPQSLELGQSLTTGLISNERKINNNNLLQLSMSINSGNSGGPLFSENGQLHGVVTSKLYGFNTEGIAFAIPSHLIKGYLNLQVK